METKWNVYMLLSWKIYKKIIRRVKSNRIMFLSHLISMVLLYLIAVPDLNVWGDASPTCLPQRKLHARPYAKPREQSIMSFSIPRLFVLKLVIGRYVSFHTVVIIKKSNQSKLCPAITHPIPITNQEVTEFLRVGLRPRLE